MEWGSKRKVASDGCVSQPATSGGNQNGIPPGSPLGCCGGGGSRGRSPGNMCINYHQSGHWVCCLPRTSCECPPLQNSPHAQRGRCLQCFPPRSMEESEVTRGKAGDRLTKDLWHGCPWPGALLAKCPNPSAPCVSPPGFALLQVVWPRCWAGDVNYNTATTGQRTEKLLPSPKRLVLPETATCLFWV